MLRQFFGCCDNLTPVDRFERTRREPFQGRYNGRGSRFLEVTTNPLNRTAQKMPLQLNKTINCVPNTHNLRSDTRGSDSSSNNFGIVYDSTQQAKPMTPILELTNLKESNIFHVASVMAATRKS